MRSDRARSTSGAGSDPHAYAARQEQTGPGERDGGGERGDHFLVVPDGFVDGGKGTERGEADVDGAGDGDAVLRIAAASTATRLPRSRTHEAITRALAACTRNSAPSVMGFPTRSYPAARSEWTYALTASPATTVAPPDTAGPCPWPGRPRGPPSACVPSPATRRPRAAHCLDTHPAGNRFTRGVNRSAARCVWSDMSRRVLLAAAAALLLAACGSASSPPTAPAASSGPTAASGRVGFLVKNYAFPALTVAPGTRVTTAPSTPARSAPRTPGRSPLPASPAATPSPAGSTPSMHGTIVVRRP